MSSGSAGVGFICTSLYDRLHKPFHCLYLPQVLKMFAPLLKESSDFTFPWWENQEKKKTQHTIKSGKVEVFMAAHPHRCGAAAGEELIGVHFSLFP